MEQRRCVYCRRRFTPIRNSNQHYCSKPPCQKKRRSKYQQVKLKKDIEYKETHCLSQKKWQKSHPEYWRNYRLNHPKYVVTNRSAQVIRDKNRRHSKQQAGHNFMLANMYSLFQENEYISYGYKTFLGEDFACKYVLDSHAMSDLLAWPP